MTSCYLKQSLFDESLSLLTTMANFRLQNSHSLKYWFWGLLGAFMGFSLGTTVIIFYFRPESSLKASQLSISPTVSPDTPEAVAALGYLEPQGGITQISATAFLEGSRVDKILVKQGETVEKGEIMAILDNNARLRAALKQAQANLGLAVSKLEKVREGAKKGEIMAQDSRRRQSKAELEGQIMRQKAAISSLESELEGEKLGQKATVERIKAELNNALTDCQRYQSLYRNGAVSQGEKERFCLEATTTQKRLQEAEANLQRITTTLEQKIQEARANLQRTLNTLEQQIQENQAMLSAVTEIRPVDLQIAQDEVMTAKANVERAQAELELSYVRAPHAGRILKIHTFPGELVKNEGILDLGNIQKMYVTAEVYETDISRVKLGQSVTIKTDKMLGDLEGTVEEIGWKVGRQDVLGTDPVVDTDARVVEVKVSLDHRSSAKVNRLTNLKVNVIIHPN
ncbi:ABC exporter membrane fusion protein [Microcystis wesenbergii FACHB-1317]|uniref:ABC exporter membrane fusion protein n=1 Tax=Microcystis TaxID=1125 RepID=UPI000E3A5311|nr:MULTISPECIES: ABC exporter membrane fusion protein [Microcystis]MBD2288761.1 ABC exporter membrane fusion protein [Microcystis wesenbergii FACHB-1317]REJ59280.1 MAG: HlyD family efflux transporter periplasmic adaptor subunit [Microcystis aeruginosa TA09]UZO77380.1 ABC exporter membrane fusion protein [Microcystis aeruginosa str. Chao 1910]